jgi:threonine/homoserine/homoserine lactone efflux protein
MDERFLALVLFAAVMSFTPGPNVVMVTAAAANFGFRRVVPQMAGITAGFAVMVLVLGAGLAGLFRANPRLHALLTFASVGYLLYLAWRIATARGWDDGERIGRPIGFLAAALFQWVNPKGWVFALAALATYSAPHEGFRQVAVVTGVLAAACLLSVLAWAAFGTLIRRALANARARATFNVAMAGLLVLSLLPAVL